MHIKHIHCAIEKLAESVNSEIENKGIKNVNAKEILEASEILENLCKAEYYATITKAMNESEYGVDYDTEGRKGYDSYRYKNGRFAPKGKGMRMGYTEPPYYHMMPDYDMDEMERMRDMDKMDGKMYYTEPMRMGDMKYDRSIPESKYDKAKRGYSEKKEMGKESPESMKGLEDMLNVVGEDIKELKPNMSAQEKALVKQKLSTWMQTLG